MENYESLLNEAYSKVTQNCKDCERTEIKKPEAHFEGNKTIIDNYSQIVACLRREPAHLAKFLFKELATPGEIAGDRLILIRKMPIIKIVEKIQLYAYKFVICPNCKKPDTEITEENGQKYLRCLACGNKIKIVDY
jgi:translation initiation factor 2 subunit 2